MLISDAGRYNDGEGQWTSMLQALGNTGGTMPMEQARWEVRAAFEVLSAPGVGFGAIKSTLQKLARVQANRVRFPDKRIVNGRIVVMVALALCFSSRGDGFVPDLGLFVRGQTAALKRLAVVMVEDAWPLRQLLRALGHGERNPGCVLAALLGASLVTSRVPSYAVPRDVVVSSLVVMAASLHSPACVAWRQWKEGKNLSTAGSVLTSK
eukprot:889630-Prymnesium_polylepis.1